MLQLVLNEFLLPFKLKKKTMVAKKLRNKKIKKKKLKNDARPQ